MSDDYSPLPWTEQQWASLRSAVQDAARKARVASSFLPLAGAVPADQTTVPAQWMDEEQVEKRQRGEADQRLETKSGKTLQLSTISCNVYLRGSEAADPELRAAKSMMRRAAEVLGRLEDAIIFRGLPDTPEPTYPVDTSGNAIVKPVIYTVSGGRGLTGLIEAPGTLWNELGTRERQQFADDQRKLVRAILDSDAPAETAARAALARTRTPLTDREDRLQKAVDKLTKARGKSTFDALNATLSGAMCVALGPETKESPIVAAVVRAIEKLEERGQFGPFALVLGDDLFRIAHTPNENSLVLPSDRILPFLDGGPLLRLSALPSDEGVVVALAGEPVELVIGTDMDVQYLQTTLEPRYVLRVYERFVLRIKQLDAICSIVREPESALRVLARDRTTTSLR